jgi:LysM repeat protein
VPTLDLSVRELDINGLASPTPENEVEAGCEPREDWRLTYQIQAFDTLSSIADLYGTDVFTLADGNCLENPDVISIGQTIRVPGDAPPAQPEYECVPWEVLTPINNAFDIDGAGTLTFVWRGPRAPRNLVRVYDSSGNVALEVNVDLAQNATINLPLDLPNAGNYTWYVYPLDWNFSQIPCPEGGPWTFHKNDGS